MKIYSMTATFGKLEHETLTLKPGLNVIEAPNEWGKSTWCAFLAAMFYGLDTRAKSTRTNLADKDRYAPWSGSPMSGRIDLRWRRRDITIERTTRGRIPMGQFRAYETATGIDIPELTAANCGRKLLGVEKSVFLRSGFLRLKDLPVSEDEALRRRLNALVTTGDESGRGEKLAGELKDLKNRIQYNRTGLLPQAEARRDAIEETIRELSQLQEQKEQSQQRLEQLNDWQMLLQNHLSAMAYRAAQEDARQVEAARAELEEAQVEAEQLERRCEPYPQRDTADAVLEEIYRLRREKNLTEIALLGLTEPEEPEEMPQFADCSGQEAIAMASEDRNLHWELSEKKNWLLLLGPLLLAAGLLLSFRYNLEGLVLGALGALVTGAGLILQFRRRGRIRSLEQYYGSSDPDLWLRNAEIYASRQELYLRSRKAYHEERIQLREKLEQLQTNIQMATEGRSLDQCAAQWQEVLADWDALEQAREKLRLAQQHYDALKAMARTAAAPEFPDRMEYSDEETQGLLSECAAQRQQTENRMGQLQGRMDALGDPLDLAKQLSRENERIEQLEQQFAAVALAQETLAEAAEQLQRRFAPRISHRAREWMGKLTEGRYDRVQLDRDLGLRAGAGQEDVLREAMWRSDGTVDQLYFALRLAVAEELTPGAPLVLDDALVRFDDARLKAALEILKEVSRKKQILLFTCQSREKNLI